MIVDDLGRIPMSPNLAAALSRASEYAAAQSHLEVTLEHLLLALTEDGDAAQVLEASHVELGRLNADISTHLGRIEERLEPGQPVRLTVSGELKRILEAAAAAAMKGRRREINGAIVLAAIVGDGRTVAAHMLRAQGLTFEEAIRVLRAPPQSPRPAAQSPAAAPVPAPPVYEPVPPSEGRGAPSSEDFLANARERVQTRTHPPVSQPALNYQAPPEADGRHHQEREAFGGEVAPTADQTWAEQPTETAAEAAAASPPPAVEAHWAPRPPAQPASPPPLPPPFADAEPRRPPQQAAPPTGRPTAHPLYPLHAPQVTRPPPPPAGERPPRSPYPPPRPVHPGSIPAGPGGAAPPPPPGGYAPWSEPREGGPQATMPPMGPPPLPPMDGRMLREQPAQQRAGAEHGERRRAGRHVGVEAGQLAENIPRRMCVDGAMIVEARIAKASVRAVVDGVNAGVPGHEVVATKALAVRLKAPQSGFTIEPTSPETQWIEGAAGLMSDDYASWRWVVTPRHSGRQRLQLVVSARTIGVDGLAAETALPDQVIDVRVRANWARPLKLWTGWLVAAAAGAAAHAFGGASIVDGAKALVRLING
jgi:hypothetical protein